MAWIWWWILLMVLALLVPLSYPMRTSRRSRERAVEVADTYGIPPQRELDWLAEALAIVVGIAIAVSILSILAEL